MAVLLALCKQYAQESNNPASPSHPFEENKADAQTKKFDPESVKSKQMLTLLNLTKESNLFYNLLVIINTVDLGTYGRYTNQYNKHIQKFGQSRLRSLEIINQLLSFLHPSYGQLAQAQIAANPEFDPEEPPHADLAMDKYINKTIRR